MFTTGWGSCHFQGTAIPIFLGLELGLGGGRQTTDECFSTPTLNYTVSKHASTTSKVCCFKLKPYKGEIKHKCLFSQTSINPLDFNLNFTSANMQHLGQFCAKSVILSVHAIPNGRPNHFKALADCSVHEIHTYQLKMCHFGTFLLIT